MPSGTTQPKNKTQLKLVTVNYKIWERHTPKDTIVTASKCVNFIMDKKDISSEIIDRICRFDSGIDAYNNNKYRFEIISTQIENTLKRYLVENKALSDINEYDLVFIPVANRVPLAPSTPTAHPPLFSSYNPQAQQEAAQIRETWMNNGPSLSLGETAYRDIYQRNLNNHQRNLNNHSISVIELPNSSDSAISAAREALGMPARPAEETEYLT